jgi:hypothetical protein
MVSASALHAVLLERTEEGTVVQFRRTRSRGGTEATDLPFDEPGAGASEFEDESDDVTIEFGDSGGDDIFLGTEFDEMDGGNGGGQPDAWNFRSVLDDVLAECEERGYEDPEVAFCTSAADVDEVELRLPADEGDAPDEEEHTGLPLPAPRKELLNRLDEQYKGAVEDERVGFVPMHRTGDGRQRVLALIARPGGSVITTVAEMQEQTLARSPRARILDAEVPLYLGLARSALQLPPDTAEKTILVRAGRDDTLVLFMEGNTLRQAEHLPELTVEDPAETICSRVLLLQDEYGMGDVQHLLLAAEEDEEVLADAFMSYFASSKLRRLRAHLPPEEGESTSSLAATGVALRLLDDPAFAPSFQPLNLLPSRCKPSPFRLPVGWSVPALLVLLGVTTLGFVWYYVANANAIGERRAELRALEQEVAQADPQALERRIDSLEAASAQYAQGLEVIDRLLQGSNKWSRGLVTVTGEMNSIEGLSIAEWAPGGDTEVTVSGRASSRPRVVQLAHRLGAEIDQLTFTEVREASLYDFTVQVPLDTTEPEAIRYWRDEQGRPAEDGAGEEAAMASSVPATDASPEAGGGTAGGAAPSEEASAASGETEDDDVPGGEASSADDGAAIWTIVVGSLSGREAAQTAREQVHTKVADRGYDVTVRRSPENGRYRVGIGAFSSYDDARAAADAMGSLLPEAAWLHRCTALAEGSVRSAETDPSSGPPAPSDAASGDG